MRTFRCKYRDVNNPWEIREEIVRAPNESQAFEQFVKLRREDQWSLSDIFVHSRVEVVAEDTHEVFTVNPYGEVKEQHTVFPL